MSDTQQREESAKALYSRLKQERDSYTRRAEACAKVTIPSLFPEESASASSSFDQPYQSIGSRCLNNLSNKLLLALFPPNATFFRLQASAELTNAADGSDENKKKLDAALAGLEQLILRYIESNQIRVTIGEGLKQLAIAGNCLLYLPPNGGIKLYKLHNYVVQRDALGTVIHIVTVDGIAYAALPDELKGMVDDNDIKPETQVDVYTHIYLEDGQYLSYQEINEKAVPGSDGSYPQNNYPWFPLRMVKVDGESYGRGYVEEYYGDLKEADAVSKSLGELIALEAFVVHLVNPTGQTRIKPLKDAKSGDFIPGRPDDISVYQTGKAGSIQIAMSFLQSIAERLGYAFMLNSSVQRNGERVTAEEIRYVAQELEDNLGSIYSILTQELQLPLVRRLLSQLQTAGYIKELPEGAVNPQITTGMEALGRGHDLMKLQTFLQFAATLPETASRLKGGGILSMAANSLGLDTSTLVKSDEEVQQEQEQAALMQAAQSAIPEAAQQGLPGGAPQPQQ